MTRDAPESLDADVELIDFACCLAGRGCVAALQGDRERADHSWGAAELLEVYAGEVISPDQRERYRRILAPLLNDGAFIRGYQAARAAPIDLGHGRSILIMSAQPGGSSSA